MLNRSRYLRSAAGDIGVRPAAVHGRAAGPQLAAGARDIAQHQRKE